MPYTATDPRLPFQSGSETSHEAAVRAQDFSGDQVRRVLGYMKRVASATQREASERLAIGRPSICARFRELEIAGLIVKTAERRAGCFVYRATV